MVILFAVACGARAGFSSLYVFGDGICTTTNNTSGDPRYYGKRFSNGRVWIEVLAQRQGLPYETNKNLSYFGHDSISLVTNVSRFVTPADATNSLFVVWANDADFVGFLGKINPPYTTNNSLNTWTTNMNASLTNHFRALTNLYFTKSVRTLILPNAVDLMEVPYYGNFAVTNRNFVRQRIITYNVGFSNTLNLVETLCPGLKIYRPDIFSLLDNVLTNAATYGLTNALYNQGQGNVSIDAISAPFISAATNGAGTNFIFWDNLDPTAKMHAVIADYVQQLISPVQVSQVVALENSNRLDLVNVPVGLSGFVESLTNLAQTNWLSIRSFSSTNVAQSVSVPASGPQAFYRLRFPYAWTWP